MSIINFYIGSSISDLDVRDNNVEFDDELLDFICEKSRELFFVQMKYAVLILMLTRNSP